MTRHIVNYTASIMLLILCSFYSVHATLLVKGDDAAPEGKSFSFPVRGFTGGTRGAFYAGAHPTLSNAGIAKAFSLSAIDHDSKQFYGFTPEKVKLNQIEDQLNPLYDAGITLFDLVSTSGSRPFSFSDLPVVVTSKNPSAIYLIESFVSDKNTAVLSVDSVLDAYGKPTSGILDIAVTVGKASAVFAAVKPSDGEFGEPGGGIALLNLADKNIEGGGSSEGPTMKKRILTFEQGDALIFSEKLSDEEIQAAKRAKPDEEPKTFRICTHTPVFSQSLEKRTIVACIHEPLSAMGPDVSLSFDNRLERLYIATQVIAGSSTHDGGRALIIGATDGIGALHLFPIAPSSVFINNNGIVGGKEPNAAISLHKVQTWWSSPGLPHVVVVGGNGNAAHTKNCVYALPICGVIADNDKRPALLGTLAKRTATPKEYFFAHKPYQFAARYIDEPAVNPEDIFTTDDTPENVPARVGGGPLAAGDIDELIVYGDAIFALVSSAHPGHQPGIYHSQALFDERGMVNAWTYWKPATNSTEPVFNASYNPISGTFITLTGTDTDHLDMVKRSAWGAGDEQSLAPLITLISEEYSASNVYGLTSYSLGCSPLGIPGLDIGMLVVTGNKKITLAQTAYRTENGPQCVSAQKDAIAKTVYPQGEVTSHDHERIISFSGGALEKLGGINCAALSWHNSNGLLFVGGQHGVAVLQHSNKRGWNVPLGDRFVGITEGMKFIPVGDYRFVRKLIADEQFLYVLTDTRFDRIDCSTSAFKTVTLAHAKNFSADYGTFFDCIVSERFALLATNEGLFSSNLNEDIRTFTDASKAHWKQVPVASIDHAVHNLSAVSQTGRETDVARGAGGMIYVLSGSRTKSRSSVDRLAVIRAPDGALRLGQVSHPVVKDQPSALFHYDELKKGFITDGAAIFCIADRNLEKPVTFRSGTLKNQIINETKTASTIASVLHQGAWFVAGDFGVRVVD